MWMLQAVDDVGSLLRLLHLTVTDACGMTVDISLGIFF